MDDVVLNHRNTHALAQSAISKTVIQDVRYGVAVQSPITRIVTQDYASSIVIHHKASKAIARSSSVPSLDYNMLYNKPSIGGVELHTGLQVIDIIEPGANIEVEEREISAPELTAAQTAALLTDD